MKNLEQKLNNRIFSPTWPLIYEIFDVSLTKFKSYKHI